MGDDVDRLVDELNALRPGLAAPSEGELAPLTGWLQELVNLRGSDLLLVAGLPPSYICDGRVRSDDLRPPVDAIEIEHAVLPALPPHARRHFREGGIADASLKLAGLGRFRINLHRERGRAAASIRLLPARPPALATLGLPPSVEQLSRLPRGLVLVSGPTNTGKTTTIAALVDAINARERRHIVTIEDPIEYEHPHRQSVVEQVEIGVDAPDFPTALRAALRQAPDVLVVGEMRDPETMRIAVAAAETGHLVFSSVHATDAAAAVGRIVDSFPPERQNSIRQELAMALAAVLMQTLIPRPSGGRVPAAELLMVSYGARQHIRKNLLHHLQQEVTITRKLGSFTFEESLAELVKNGAIDRQQALERALHTEELEALLRGA
jgi:twitching motility protein PilT